MSKVDFKKAFKELYNPPRDFVVVDVPEKQFLMVDGAVRFISENIDSRTDITTNNNDLTGTYQRLATISGQEVIGEF